MTNSPIAPSPLLIGAIRWDAWYDPANGAVAQAVEADLQPSTYTARAPSFTTVNANGTLAINGDNTAEMTREIQLARAAGINYWAFDYYGSGDPMNNALQLYLQNPLRNQVDFALIDTAGWGATSASFAPQIAQRASLMQQPSYQRVQGNRPLYYLMLPNAQTISQWWGSNPANMKTALDALRHQVIATTGANPYVVVMGAPIQAAAFAQLIGADGISAYAITGTDQNASFQTLSNTAQAGWNAELATGLSVVPTVMTGWNPSPRIDTPVPWGSSGTSTYATATPAQIAAQLSSAMAWLLAHPGGTAGTALVYAWNEFDEGGWLAPTYIAGNPAGDTSRLAAIAAVTALYQGAQAVRNADGSFSITLGNGSVERFSASGVLLRTIGADGSTTVYNPDNSISKLNAAGRLLELDRADGSSVVYGSDGSQTLHAINGNITKIIAVDGSSKLVWSDGWLWFDTQGHYLQHESDLADGSKNFYNAAGHLTETVAANGNVALTGATIGLSASLVFINPSSTTTNLTDLGSGMTIVVGPKSTSATLLNLAHDPAWKLDLTGGVGGFCSVAAVLAAFHSDGHGGAVLGLPGGVSVDLVGVMPAGHVVIQ